ncbi:MAG: hypothetical protein R2785_07155 [Flavobacteriaceae bacterium]
MKNTSKKIGKIIIISKLELCEFVKEMLLKINFLKIILNKNTLIAKLTKYKNPNCALNLSSTDKNKKVIDKETVKIR